MPERSKKEQLEAIFREVLDDRPPEEERNDHKPGSGGTLKQVFIVGSHQVIFTGDLPAEKDT